MDNSRFALQGIAVAIIVAVSAALFAACASEDEPSQADQSRQEQQESQDQQAQPAPATQSAGDSSRDSTSSTATGQAPQDQGEAQAESGQRVAQAQSSDSQQSTATNEATQQQQDSQPDPVETQQQEAQPEQQQPEPQQDEPAQQAQSTAQPEASEQEQDQEQQQAEPEEPSGPSEREQLELRAEEIAAQSTVTDLVGLNGWLNGEETTIALELAKGNVVLVDFWTYTCINCVRTLPFLTAWDEKYREHGLVILGVHTPEFEFEKVPANIRGAIAEYGIEYDVPMDNDYRTWRAFNNRFWPAKYLIGPTGDSPMGVRYFHFGEGHYDETEEQIRLALEAVGRDLSDVPVGVNVAVPDRSDVARGRQTRELYGGWRRNTGGGGPYAGQEEYFLAGLGAEHLYVDVDSDERVHNLWYLEGLWRAESEAIAHARTTENLEDYMAMIVRGRTVNVVLTVAENGQPYDVFVQYNDDWVQPGFAGEHIQWDGSGRSFIRVNQNDLYRLLFFEDFTSGELKLSSNSDQFRIFAFTFGSYVGGE